MKNRRETGQTNPPPKKAVPRGGLSSRMPLMLWVALAVLFLIAIVLDAFFSDSGILEVWHLEQEYQQDLAESEQIRLENERLQRRIDALSGDPAAVEGVAREELNLGKPDEEIYLFPEEPKREDFVRNPDPPRENNR